MNRIEIYFLLMNRIEIYFLLMNRIEIYFLLMNRIEIYFLLMNRIEICFLPMNRIEIYFLLLNIKMKRSNTLKYTYITRMVKTSSGIVQCLIFSRYCCLLLSFIPFFLEKEKCLSVTRGLQVMTNAMLYQNCPRLSSICDWASVIQSFHQSASTLESIVKIASRLSITLASSICVWCICFWSGGLIDSLRPA